MIRQLLANLALGAALGLGFLVVLAGGITLLAYLA